MAVLKCSIYINSVLFKKNQIYSAIFCVFHEFFGDMKHIRLSNYLDLTTMPFFHSHLNWVGMG